MNELQTRYLQLRNDIKSRLEQLCAASTNRTQTWSDHTSKWKAMDFQLLDRTFRFFDPKVGYIRVAVGTVKNGVFIMCQEGATCFPFEVIDLDIVQQLRLIEEMEG